MPQDLNSEQHHWLKKYIDLYGLVATLLGIATVVIYLCSTFLYCREIVDVERISNRSLSPLLTCLLLGVPIATQFIGFVLLRRKMRQTIYDDRLTAYFKFYSWRMAISLFSYTLLWACYVIIFLKERPATWLVLVFSGITLIFIVGLIGIVVQATYLITKTSFNDEGLLLTEHEVEVNYAHICDRLKHSPEVEVQTIREGLLKDRDSKVHRVTLKKEVTDLDVAHLTEALNRLITNRRFHLAHAVPVADGPRSTKPSLHKNLAAAHANREYLQRHLLGTPSTTPHVEELSSKDRAKQNRLVEQKDQRDGIAMFPFYTMTFFFSIFLCIAYLFGLAFAFQDRYVQLSDPLGQVALFMTDDLLEDTERLTNSPLLRADDFKDLASFATKLRNQSDRLSMHLNMQLSEGTQRLLKMYDGANPVSLSLQDTLMADLNKLISEKSLYDEHLFESYMLREQTRKLIQSQHVENTSRLNRLLLEDAYPLEIARSQQRAPAPPPPPVTYKLNKEQKVFYFKSGGAGVTTNIDNPDKGMKRIALNNQSSLDSVVRLIKEALKKNGVVVRVELIGRADDNSVDKVTYASNYEIAAARVKSVRFLLQEKLIEEQLSPEDLAAIDWVESSFSNDETLPLKESDDGEASLIAHILNNENSHVEKPASKVSEKFIDAVDNLNIESGPKAWKEELRDFLDRLKGLSQKGVEEKTMQAILDHINEWDRVKEENEKKAVADATEGNKKAEKLWGNIDAELYQYEDPSGRMRVVEVYLFDTATPVTRAESEPNHLPHFKRMALMDYLYFAMYTITTTGYGDIRPTTTYTKFLCTLANMTEFFFIVVFFNTLLSLKRGREEIGAL
jgi:ion channel